MSKPSEKDSREQKEVKLRPEAVKALTDHTYQLQKLSAQVLMDSALLAANVRCLLEELRLIKLITHEEKE